MIEGIGPAMYVPDDAAATVRIGHLFSKKGAARSRNASTVRVLFRFTAVRFPINSSSLAFAYSTYIIHFARGCAVTRRSPCTSPRPVPSPCRPQTRSNSGPVQAGIEEA
jgi:hypothetical protein